MKRNFNEYSRSYRNRIVKRELAEEDRAHEEARVTAEALVAAEDIKVEVDNESVDVMDWVKDHEDFDSDNDEYGTSDEEINKHRKSDSESPSLLSPILDFEFKEERSTPVPTLPCQAASCSSKIYETQCEFYVIKTPLQSFWARFSI